MTQFPDALDCQSFRLRPVGDADMPAIVEQLSDPRIAQWLATVSAPFGPEDAQEFLEYSRHPAERVRVIERDRAVAGCIGLGSSLWYWLGPDHWGQGLMHHALGSAIAACFASPAPPLVATSREDNAASVGLLTRLGFSRSPAPRRMFFRSTMTSHRCRDYVMTSEQWHFLHPPRIRRGLATLRPALQKDGPALARMLPRAGDASAPAWPSETPDGIPGFIEAHRYRGRPAALYMIEDATGSTVGALLQPEGATAPHLLFRSPEDAQRHAGTDWAMGD